MAVRQLVPLAHGRFRFGIKRLERIDVRTKFGVSHDARAVRIAARRQRRAVHFSGRDINAMVIGERCPSGGELEKDRCVMLIDRIGPQSVPNDDNDVLGSRSLRGSCRGRNRERDTARQNCRRLSQSKPICTIQPLHEMSPRLSAIQSLKLVKKANALF